MISPYVRRLRLAKQLRVLREQAGLTAEALAKLTGLSRTKISRLENGTRRPDIADVMKVLDTLEVTEESWRALVQVARGAGERGWWEGRRFTAMGERQALIADLETGSCSVRDYQTTFIPGLLQTEALIAARAEVARRHGDLATRAAEGRLERQRRFWHADGPRLDVLLEETLVRRPVAPAEIMAEQLRRLIEAATDGERVTLRIVPVEAPMVNFPPPRSSFTLYRYPDPDDPTVISVDTVTTDLILAEAQDVAPYESLWDRLVEVALPLEETVDLLERTAKRYR